jgi:ABC-type bacteriocin/lantibiotic exporter with double-glycine peptidase domain
VLDEPTASLDPDTERQVIDGYESVMRGRTTIVITHRQDVATRAHRVIALHHGGRGGLEEASVLAGLTSESPVSPAVER